MDKLSPRLLIELLDLDGLSTEGSLEELRDHRVRFDVRRVDATLDVPVYREDFRGENLPATTADLLTQMSRKEITPPWLSDAPPARAEINTRAEVHVENVPQLEAPPLRTSKRIAPSESTGVMAPDAPTPSSSRVWSALTALPRLFFRREYREAMSQSGNHVVGEERVGIGEIRRDVPRN